MDKDFLYELLAIGGHPERHAWGANMAAIPRWMTIFTVDGIDFSNSQRQNDQRGTFPRTSLFCLVLHCIFSLLAERYWLISPGIGEPARRRDFRTSLMQSCRPQRWAKRRQTLARSSMYIGRPFASTMLFSWKKAIVEIIKAYMILDQCTPVCKTKLDVLASCLLT
jgi:hypothetical protein